MFSTVLECSQMSGVLSECNIRFIRFLYLLYDVEVMWRKTINHGFSIVYTLINHGFLTNQCAPGPIYIIITYDCHYYVMHGEIDEMMCGGLVCSLKCN